MTVFQGAGALFALIAAFGFVNQRFIKLPDTLGITAVGLIASSLVTILGISHPEMVSGAQRLVDQIDFPDIVFHGLLSLLLFAAALHVDLSRMKEYKLTVFLLSTVGVVLSTAFVGAGMFFAANLLGHPLSLAWCLVFGALISPTDAIAVMSVLKKIGAPEGLEMRIAGESLFNDGTAVVGFVTLLGIATGTAHFSAIQLAVSLFREIVGAVVIGFIVGYGAFFVLRGIDSYPVEILVTLAVATAGYSLAESLGVSAPLAVVVMGLVIGNHAMTKVMSERTREHLTQFWSLLDELLNLLLFGLVGLEVIALSMHMRFVFLGLAAVPIVLAARASSVAIPTAFAKRFRGLNPGYLKVMTWGGLRGGISIALALSLPAFDGRDLLIGVTYIVVLFSLLVQATTLGPFIKRLNVGA
ncbi:sodium:proton antiporter [Paraburkholderia sp. UCT31]|uniref:cation:proton antiporter n=1 Tax=Paraburkholderia sp. UCT31 TaxID=2615209 RepID=UPI001654DE06|nr:sodium:proton antiporter [Paraburkholderia sp. UCT31]MBC8741713.1 sodium:proton antiporter [Paraburkholderia sp. UCT31]